MGAVILALIWWLMAVRNIVLGLQTKRFELLLDAILQLYTGYYLWTI